MAHRGIGEHVVDSEIYTINLGGGGRIQVTNNETGAAAPSYSPDGKKIAYSGWDGHDGEIFTINVGGGKAFNVTDSKTDESDPSRGRRP